MSEFPRFLFLLHTVGPIGALFADAEGRLIIFELPPWGCGGGNGINRA
jgi:hypothetical protein